MQDLRAPEGMYVVWNHDPRDNTYLFVEAYHNVVTAMTKALDHNSAPGQITKAMVSNDQGRIVDVYDPRSIL